jgi:hypothetical protein
MAQRLLVMNGQRLLQSERDGAWTTDKVDKAGQIKPGIYRLDAAQAADQSKSHLGVIVHADKQAVYQQSGMSLVRHDAAAFSQPPQIGAPARIDYEGGRAAVAQYIRHGRHGPKR